MKGILAILLGALVFMIGIWGGAFLLGEFPSGSLYHFPSYTTAFVISIAGLAICVAGAYMLK